MSAHKYELMFIADPELDERGLKKLMYVAFFGMTGMF